MPHLNGRIARKIFCPDEAQDCGKQKSRRNRIQFDAAFLFFPYGFLNILTSIVQATLDGAFRTAHGFGNCRHIHLVIVVHDYRGTLDFRKRVDHMGENLFRSLAIQHQIRGIRFGGDRFIEKILVVETWRIPVSVIPDHLECHISDRPVDPCLEQFRL